MAWPWFSPNRKNGVGACVRRAFTAAMGCFLSCFGVKDFDLDSPQDYVGSRKKNDLTLVFDSEDEPIRRDEESVHLLPPEEREFKALEDEARFLKACGTIPDTPVEIRNAVKKWDKDESTGIEERVVTDLWPDNASAETLIPGQLSNESPTPVEVSDDWVNRADSFEDSPHSCMIDGHRGEFTSSTQSSCTQNVDSPIDVCDSEFIISIQTSHVGTVGIASDGSDGKSTISIQSSDAEDVSAPNDLLESENQSATSPASPMAYTPSLQLQRKSVRFECEPDDESANSLGGSSSDVGSRQTPFKFTGSDLRDSENRPETSPTSPMAYTPSLQLQSKSVRFECEPDDVSAHSLGGSSSDVGSRQTPFKFTGSDFRDSENRPETSPASPMGCTPSVQLKNKSVRFECELDESSHSSKGSSSDDASRHMRTPFTLTGSATSVSRMSPFPTPLKLTDDMQTPGTVFLSHRRNVDAGKTARVRSLYVYSATGQLEYLDTSLTLNGGATFPSTPSVDSDMEMKHLSDERGKDYEASLSSWLKPPANKDGDKEPSLSMGSVDCESTPADRLNLVLTSEAVSMSHISPTLWDAHGIPNTTHKYQEDQKVRWHATPFEERLEKALSGETSVSRKLVSKVQPVQLDVIEESDTAPSGMSGHPKSGA